MSAATDLRDAGQQMALFNSPGWKDYILVRLQAFCASRKKEGNLEFRVEEFEAWLQPWEQPASRNAWGSLPAIACRAGIIAWAERHERAKRPSTHARDVKVWRAL
jgi:hypothetical protein